MDCIEPRHAGEEITIPVRAKQFNEISGMQFTLSWDKDVLTFESVENGKLQSDFATQKTNEGMLGVLWTDERAEGKSITGDEVLFTLKFIANRVGEECDVNFTSAMIPVEAVNGNLELLELAEWKGESIKVNEYVSNGYRVYQNYPNPFSESTVIGFELPNKETVTVEVLDFLGNRIYNHVAIYDAGKHSINLEGARFSAGVYFLQFKTGNISRSFKIVRLKKT